MTHYSFSELGQRANNEDCFALDNERVFVVCDGVGGSDKGEIASKLVANSFLQALIGGGDVNGALSMAQQGLDSWIMENPESKGMATTLAVLELKEGGVQVAWCGDSRIYQFREGEIIRQTVDHSWVNDAVKAGIITQEEAIGHPKSNVITRAIHGSHRPVQLEIEGWGEMCSGDVFMLCSDGVLECWTDEELERVMSGSSLPEAVSAIRNRCAEASNDNATAIFVQAELPANEVRDAKEARGIQPKLWASALLLIAAAILTWWFWPQTEDQGVETHEAAESVMEAISSADIQESSSSDDGQPPSIDYNAMTEQGGSDHLE